jgi:hypothetical protein
VNAAPRREVWTHRDGSRLVVWIHEDIVIPPAPSAPWHVRWYARVAPNWAVPRRWRP